MSQQINSTCNMSDLARKAPTWKERFRDFAVNLVVSVPGNTVPFVSQHFRRATLWCLFRAYSGALVLAPTGPRGNRFVMWLNPQAYSDFILGIYEPGFTRNLQRHVEPGSFCLDIGANLGYFTLLMSLLTGAEGRIVAFEPMPDTLQVLRKNIEVNQLKNVTVVGAAVSDHSGSVELLSQESQQFTKTASTVGYRLEGATRSTVASAIRLDDYFGRADRLPSVIKIDVEGGELEVLKGARETILRGKPILVIEIHGWGSERSGQVIHLLSELEYDSKVVEIRPPEALCLAKPIDLINDPQGTGTHRA
jgi:FkbM family methyltransferase